MTQMARYMCVAQELLRHKLVNRLLRIAYRILLLALWLRANGWPYVVGLRPVATQLRRLAEWFSPELRAWDDEVDRLVSAGHSPEVAFEMLERRAKAHPIKQ